MDSVPHRSIWTGKRFETLQGVCDEKTVCRSAKSGKEQPLEAGTGGGHTSGGIGAVNRKLGN